ncbi:MAG TPA: hypothetical protein VNX68_02320 [Nitrosopumilaceae archaeon]|jgi:hypothetical protein|nr:hypothetical protein [Nitrosopumilaceae archaeon]
MARYTYYCVGYGLTLPVGNVYASGRIEVYDSESPERRINEFPYWIPLEQESEWRNFWDNLKTDYPLSIGQTGWESVEKEHEKIAALADAQKKK